MVTPQPDESPKRLCMERSDLHAVALIRAALASPAAEYDPERESQRAELLQALADLPLVLSSRVISVDASWHFEGERKTLSLMLNEEDGLVLSEDDRFYDPGVGSDHSSRDFLRVTPHSRFAEESWDVLAFTERFVMALRDPSWQCLYSIESALEEGDEQGEPESPWDDDAFVLGFDPADAALVDDIRTGLRHLLGQETTEPWVAERLVWMLHALDRLPYSTPRIDLQVRLIEVHESGSNWMQIWVQEDRLVVSRGGTVPALDGTTDSFSATTFEVDRDWRDAGLPLEVAALGEEFLLAAKSDSVSIEVDEMHSHAPLDRPEPGPENPWLHAFAE